MVKKCANAIFRKGGLLPCCIGFIDGTVRGIARPHNRLQKVVYNGHKRKHAIKFQSIVAPDGIIIHLFGPEAGSRHDAYVFQRSGLADSCLDISILLKRDMSSTVIPLIQLMVSLEV